MGGCSSYGPLGLPARFAMPVEAWQRMIEAHYPFRRWIPLDAHTFERLASAARRSGGFRPSTRRSTRSLEDEG